MDVPYLMQVLQKQVDVVRGLLADVSPLQARWKPDPDRWSILEVINHLYDEEREDFRIHLDTILHRPEDPWHPIDPMGWVEERRYNERELDASLANFLEERRASLAWLAELASPDWDAEIEAPWGVMRAGDMLASWVVHGQWHIEQLVRVRRDYTIQQSLPYSARYAGTL
jgi:hypothetical protein